MVHSQDNATRFRHRAEELRSIRESITDPKLRDDIERWAKEYDRMVKGLEAK